MLIQTADVVARLKAAGLQRREFMVRCERLMRGRTFRGYGDTQITLLCPLARQQEMAPALAQHFHVIQYTIDGRKSSVHVYDEAPHGLFIKEVGEKR